MPHLHVHVITIIGPDITETAVDMSEQRGSINRNCITENNAFKARLSSKEYNNHLDEFHISYIPLVLFVSVKMQKM